MILSGSAMSIFHETSEAAGAFKNEGKMDGESFFKVPFKFLKVKNI